MLLDPSWLPTRYESPPVEAMVGGWQVNADGGIGPFQPNPDYLPSAATVPTDPTDALLRMAAQGKDIGDELVPRLLASVVEIGCDEHDQPVIRTAPDGVPCVVVATAALQRAGVAADRWWPILGSRLLDVVPPDADILLNPGGLAAFRLIAGALRAVD
ncbi:type VII secretion system-associated protein [Nocardia colli]|uniref:type VII secretion system-associated protein n=1 Tax=Nocardia colli TaxID=2545717 RepID=UPI0035D8E30C